VAPSQALRWVYIRVYPGVRPWLCHLLRGTVALDDLLHELLNILCRCDCRCGLLVIARYDHKRCEVQGRGIVACGGRPQRGHLLYYPPLSQVLIELGQPLYGLLGRLDNKSFLFIRHRKR